MNPNIRKLCAIAAKPARRIIGLMSGTSFDGLDIALCEFTGSGHETGIRLLKFVTRSYTPTFKEQLKSVFARQEANLERITLLNAYIGAYYARLINDCLAEWNLDAADIDLVASHGQSIFHSPKHQRPPDEYGNATLQIGDADHLAVNTGIITVSDFRQKHIAAGGEGAPLAVYGDYLLFSAKTENRIMLNIGGIANFTWLPARAAQTETCFSTDAGPGNTLMDQFVQASFPGRYYDKDAEIGSKGRIDEPLLAALQDHAFFKAPFPKTTGPELFNLDYLRTALKKRATATEMTPAENATPYDIMATLARFTALSIIDAIESALKDAKSLKHKNDFEIYISGGGMYNPLVLRHLETHFGKKLRSTADLDIHPDAKEAVLFALLANETIAGSPKISMGKISFPM
ncbi:MAG TPA: anhydro-N-acetylmuramic acid kinase [Puia sp.]|nr:anhydro-N-acetylmuramic acid kinase [Puia sp.]